MRPVLSTASVRKVSDAGPQVSRRLDVLTISIGENDTGLVDEAGKVCAERKLHSKTLRLDQQAGRSEADKVASLMRTLQSMRKRGEIDRATPIVILGHGFPNHDGLTMGMCDGRFPIDVLKFTAAIRTALAAAPGQDWDGLMHVTGCYAGVLREQLRNSPGHTFLHSGRKSVQSEDVNATVCAMLRTLSEQRRSPDGDNTELARKLWESTQRASGENIAWCGEGEVHIHKAIDALHANPTEQKRTQVLYAKLLHGNIQTVRRVVGVNARQMLASHRREDDPPLAAAARSARQSPQKIRFLLTSGEDINERDAFGDTALANAARYDKREAAQTLLAEGADPWTRDFNGMLPWQVALPSCLDLLVADPAATQTAPAVPDRATHRLHASIADGRTEFLDALEPGSSALRARDKHGNTPLGVALLHGQLELAARLLQLGASPDARLGNGETLLGHAVLHGPTEAVRLLLDYKAKSKRSEREGMPLLLRALHAVKAGRASAALLDLVLSTTAGKQGLKQELPLHYACLLGDPDLAIQLLESGVDLFQKDGRNRTAAQWVQDRMKQDPSWDTVEMRQALLDALPAPGS